MPPEKENRGRKAPLAGGNGSSDPPARQQEGSTLFEPVVELSQSWKIGPVDVPSRVVLAPMAGVSVQAFRRQGRRFGAGLVCSEMVSCAGLHHGNERTFGYLRIASDEHPLAVQI